MFFLMIMMKDNIYIYILGEVEQQNIRYSKSKNCFHSSFDYLFLKNLIDKLMGIKTTPHLKIV